MRDVIRSLVDQDTSPDRSGARPRRFVVAAGTATALLGPDGAGGTTTVDLLGTLVVLDRPVGSKP